MSLQRSLGRMMPADRLQNTRSEVLGKWLRAVLADANALALRDVHRFLLQADAEQHGVVPGEDLQVRSRRNSYAAAAKSRHRR